MKAKVYKDNHYPGWFWQIDDNGGTVGAYCWTRWGAERQAKRYMKKSKKNSVGYWVEG